MAKFVLLLFLLVAVGSTIASPSYSDDTKQDRVSAEREREDCHHAVANSHYDSDAEQEREDRRHAVAELHYDSDAEVDTDDDDDDDADTANEDTAMDAYHQYAINQIWGRKPKPKKKKR